MPMAGEWSALLPLKASSDLFRQVSMKSISHLFLKLWHWTGRHAYMVATILFVVFGGFLDPNSYYHRFLLMEEIRHLEDEVQHWKDLYQEDTRLLQELNEKPNAMERLARERYFMKRPNEDIFIIK